jgi:hypothetical protein
MGLRAPELQRTFSALVYHGGGVPPPVSAGCGPELSARPVFFLVGDNNPLHALAVRLRDHHERCSDDVTWRLVPGADHAAEWKALATDGARATEWLLTKRR